MTNQGQPGTGQQIEELMDKLRQYGYGHKHWAMSTARTAVYGDLADILLQVVSQKAGKRGTVIYPVTNKLKAEAEWFSFLITSDAGKGLQIKGMFVQQKSEKENEMKMTYLPGLRHKNALRALALLKSKTPKPRTVVKEKIFRQKKP